MNSVVIPVSETRTASITPAGPAIGEDGFRTQLKPQLLLIADDPERLREMRFLVMTEHVDITTVLVSEQTVPDFDFAVSPQVVVVDVAAQDLERVLAAIRSRREMAGASLLVDISRNRRRSGLAGVLPRYRAMPCSPTELRSLMRHYLNRPGMSLRRRLL